MPRDSVFQQPVERIPTGEPVVLYLPPDVTWCDVVAFRKLPTGDVRLTVRDPGADPQLDVTRDVVVPSLTGDAVDSPTVRGRYCLSVGWHRGGGVVQVGPGARDESGAELPVPGRWVDLDWLATNRLIGFLRTARDQAFGRPE